MVQYERRSKNTKILLSKMKDQKKPKDHLLLRIQKIRIDLLHPSNLRQLTWTTIRPTVSECAPKRRAPCTRYCPAPKPLDGLDRQRLELRRCFEPPIPDASWAKLTRRTSATRIRCVRRAIGCPNDTSTFSSARRSCGAMA